MKRTEQVRLYPTKRQQWRLRFMLDVTRQLYNALLEQRRQAYKRNGRKISGREQYAELTALRSEDRRVAAVFRECEDAVLHRLDLAFRAFFRRIRRGERAGYPRFKAASRWYQLAFPHGDRALKFNSVQSRLTVPGVGSVRVRSGRPVPNFGRAWITQRGTQWYAAFEYEALAEPSGPARGTVGVDLGTHVLAATSDGRLIRKSVSVARATAKVRFHQKVLECLTVRDSAGKVQNRNDQPRQKAVQRLRRACQRQVNTRRDYLHKVSRVLVRSAQVIAMESLPVRAMTRSAKGTRESPGSNVRAKAALNRAVLDAGFGLLQQMITYKAEGAGKVVVVVGARFSSQTCSQCGHVCAKSRRRRRFLCIRCGFAAHADTNAALVIRRRAQSALTNGPKPGAKPGRRSAA